MWRAIFECLEGKQAELIGSDGPTIATGTLHDGGLADQAPAAFHVATPTYKVVFELKDVRRVSISTLDVTILLGREENGQEQDSLD
jgi:hypothetical protein